MFSFGLWLPFIYKGQMFRQTLQSFSKPLRRIQILLIPTVSITSQQKCPIITRRPLLTPLKFTVFLANLVLIYSTPANLVKSPNPRFLTALLLYMGQILNPVSNLKCLKPQFKIAIITIDYIEKLTKINWNWISKIVLTT